MTETVTIVDATRAKVEAYQMGHGRFSDLSGEEAEGFDLAPFKDSATWANHVAPQLRAMAGFADGGHGTYQQDRQVVAVTPQTEGDQPRDGELMESARYIHDELVQAFDMGAYDGVEGSFDPDAAVNVSANIL